MGRGGLVVGVEFAAEGEGDEDGDVVDDGVAAGAGGADEFVAEALEGRVVGGAVEVAGGAAEPVGGGGGGCGEGRGEGGGFAAGAGDDAAEEEIWEILPAHAGGDAAPEVAEGAGGGVDVVEEGEGALPLGELHGVVLDDAVLDFVGGGLGDEALEPAEEFAFAEV